MSQTLHTNVEPVCYVMSQTLLTNVKPSATSCHRLYTLTLNQFATSCHTQIVHTNVEPVCYVMSYTLLTNVAPVCYAMSHTLLANVAPVCYAMSHTLLANVAPVCYVMSYTLLANVAPVCYVMSQTSTCLDGQRCAWSRENNYASFPRIISNTFCEKKYLPRYAYSYGQRIHRCIRRFGKITRKPIPYLFTSGPKPCSSDFCNCYLRVSARYGIGHQSWVDIVKVPCSYLKRCSQHMRYVDG